MKSSKHRNALGILWSILNLFKYTASLHALKSSGVVVSNSANGCRYKFVSLFELTKWNVIYKSEKEDIMI